MIIKAPQKREIANFGLTLSYDVSKRLNTALIYGQRLELQDSHRYDPDIKHPGLLKLIGNIAVAWDNPLVLPCILLSDHIRRTKLYCDFGSVMQETFAIEHLLGVTAVGRNVQKIPSGSQVGAERQNASSAKSFERSMVEELTVRINTQSTRIIFTSRSPRWCIDCSSFILGLADEVAQVARPPVHRELKELLQYTINLAEGVQSHVETMRERMNLQLNVLYSITAQIDNKLSARLAANSGRDSVSMKILAVITAFFLPGTFVATLFSMSMFDWQYQSESGDGSILSDRFWIYWVVSIPLTMMTLVGWAIWWKVEMARYQKAFAEAMNESATDNDKPATDADEASEQSHRGMKLLGWKISRTS